MILEYYCYRLSGLLQNLFKLITPKSFSNLLITASKHVSKITENFLAITVIFKYEVYKSARKNKMRSREKILKSPKPQSFRRQSLENFSISVLKFESVKYFIHITVLKIKGFLKIQSDVYLNSSQGGNASTCGRFQRLCLCEDITYPKIIIFGFGLYIRKWKGSFNRDGFNAFLKTNFFILYIYSARSTILSIMLIYNF